MAGPDPGSWLVWLCRLPFVVRVADESILTEVDRDFFTHLYTGETSGLNSSAVPEDYYTYLEGWYRYSYGLHGICDDVVHLQHDQSYMGCRQLPVSYWMNL